MTWPGTSDLPVNPAVGVVALVVVSVATAVIGFYGLRISRTTGDFYVASRTVRPWWNASAIGGEYLSAASFLGVAGLILLSGTDALWFPVGYTAGYLMLLLFVAAPLRRSGAYTIPDFTEAQAGFAGRPPGDQPGGGSGGLAVHRAAAPRRGPDHPDHHRASRLGGLRGRGHRGVPDRGGRRHALHHLCAGVPVLAEAHCPGRARPVHCLHARRQRDCCRSPRCR